MPRRSFNLQNYVPFYLSQIANKWSFTSSRIYLEKFGVGINEWRVMTLLAVEPGISANKISSITGIDKTLVGRSIRLLEERRLAVTRTNPFDGRSRSVWLTAAGLKVYNKIIAIARWREKELLYGFSKSETTELLSFLRRLADNALRMQTSEGRDANAKQRYVSTTVRPK